jgi:hypothetical protein
MREAADERARMLETASTALRDDRMFPYYQPKVCLKTGTAGTMKAVLEEKAGALHNATESHLLASDQPQAPTAANIRSALKRLKAAGPRDTVLMFLAGHGVNEGADYLYLGTDAAIGMPGKTRLSAGGISSARWSRLVESASCCWIPAIREMRITNV